MKELIKYLILIVSTISSLLVASCTPAGGSSSGGSSSGSSSSGGTSSAPSDPVDGVQYSYFLRLPMSMNYEADDNGLHINVFSFDNYVYTEITNNDSKTRDLGGEYIIQREENGSFTELARDSVNLMYGDTYVQDMPHVLMYEKDRTPIDLDSDEAVITLAPGESIYVNFMTMDHGIWETPEYSGNYRLIYSGLQVDFEVICDVAE